MIGAAAGIGDVLLIAVAEPSAPYWSLAQAGSAWATMGLAVVAMDSPLNPMLHGLVATLLLNVPWFIQFSVISGRAAHLLPLVIQGVVFGAAFGWAKSRLRRGRRHRNN